MAKKQNLVEQKTRGNTGNTTSVDNNILENKEMNKLKQFIEQSVKEYFQNIYMPKYDVEPYITQSWCNYTKKASSIINTHTQIVLYPVFFMYKLIKQKIQFIFVKMIIRSMSLFLKIPAKEYNLFNSLSWWLAQMT